MRRIVARASDDDLRRVTNDGWTVAATLAHIAFWDRVNLGRWQAMLRPDGPGFVSYPQELIDWVNAAGLPQWSSLAPREAAADALRTAAEIDAFIGGLPAPLVEEAIAKGRPGMVDRSNHRRHHLDQIERPAG